MLRKKAEILFLLFAMSILLNTTQVYSQFFEDESEQRKEVDAPQAVDFSKMFEEKKEDKETFEENKRRRQALIKDRMELPDALEGAVDPEVYVVGPGDVFSLNVWGIMDFQIPVIISPDGKLSIPSVGEIEVNGLTLQALRDKVMETAKPAYEKSRISLSLESLRYCRVHVTGEVAFPGTYTTQAVNRISDLIAEAGNVTERANKGEIMLTRTDGTVRYFDLSQFENSGSLEKNFFVSGGDVIYVPAVDISKDYVIVEGDFETGGLYQIMAGEELAPFLDRIRALKKNTDLNQLVVVRENGQVYKPFENNEIKPFPLQKLDVITVPSGYVYVKGAVRLPGTYPYITHFQAKDYAGMAGGDYHSSKIKSVKVYCALTGKTKKGPDAAVMPGDVVDLPTSWGEKLRNYGPMISAVASSVMAAKALGFFGD